MTVLPQQEAVQPHTSVHQDHSGLAAVFGIGTPGRPIRLRVYGRAARLSPALLPDCDLVATSGRTSIDADLLLPPRRAQATHRGSRPCLILGPGFLRTPAAPFRPLRFTSATLSRNGLSRADRLLASPSWLTPALQARTEALRTFLCDTRLGPAWWAAPPTTPPTPILVFAAPTAAATRALLGLALRDGPAAAITLVTPQRRPGLRIAQAIGAIDPLPLAERAARIYAAPGSQGALLATTLGIPLTPAAPPGLLAAHLILGTSYADPFDDTSVTPEAYAATLAEARRQTATNATVAAVCVGISFWKRRRIALMLGTQRPPAFRKTTAAAIRAAHRRQGGIAVWASRAPAGLAAAAAAHAIPLARIEDGFIRSRGLGADFLPPLSIVVDPVGLYYDATAPSALEQILQAGEIDPGMVARAAALRHRIVRDNVTKYNIADTPPATHAPHGARVVLVPGQVADDRSVLLGGAGITPGLDLLARVRARAPDAYILYKPHPDVEAGHRLGTLPDSETLAYADEIVRGGSMAALLATVDEVHTLTSLTGFEALLRGIPVTVYGHPFYAGWGLTADATPLPRRTRTLSLDQLVAATLIAYPRYTDPVTFLPCPPEIVLDRLATPGLQTDSLIVQLRRLQGRLVRRLQAKTRAAAHTRTPSE